MVVVQFEPSGGVMSIIKREGVGDTNELDLAVFAVG